HLGIDPEKISVNYPDVDEIYKKVGNADLRSLHKKYDLKPGYIYSGGGLEARKNIERLIKAYKFLLEKNKNENFIHEMPQLVISGKLMPELAPLVTDAEKLIKELNLTQRVKLFDFVPQEDLPALYGNALVFAYPSLYEGFGFPALEAMNAGTPVITSKNSSLPEVGRDAVLYCNPEDEKDIAMVIRNVILHKHLRDELRKRGKERAKFFSWEKFVEKMLDIINAN
ncbi:MAG: glycosyltransferase family 1 protein, partial [bacterium]|nr:glycosyltransferase family 1 protein [bacterium]